MAGNVYSTYELAKKMAYERQAELEQDIYICHTKYKSGQEFLLKTEDDLTCGNYLHIVPIPFRFHYKSKPNAEREASKFASKKGRPVYVRTKSEIQNGYRKIKYYYLTYKECSI